MCKSSANGFTLVELVATIIILGIISVSVVPKFSGRQGFAEYALRDEVISLLRVAKQRAMYDHGGDCYGVDLNSPLAVVTDASGSEQPLGGIATLPLTGSSDYAGITVTGGNIYFDALGNALAGADCATATAVTGFTDIAIAAGAQTLSIRVHATGYVQKI